MSIANKKVCPVCGKELPHEICIDDHDIIYVTCKTCGTYAMTAEYNEDYIQTGQKRETTAAFLAVHKKDPIYPFLSNQSCCVPGGYICYPAWRIN